MMKNKEPVACLTSRVGQRTPALVSVHAHGELHGLLLRMKLRQTYRNTSNDELETVYSFPLAWGTTLLGMRVELNGKCLTGTVIEKSEAEAKYEQAVAEGDLPVMLVREGKHIYSARLGNLKPGDEVVIDIDYGQLLVPDQGRTRITIPTTIAPRFGRDPGLRGLLAHAIGAIDPLAEYRFFLTVDIHGSLARGRIACPSHSISQQMTEHGMRIELAQKAMLDRDFILTIDADDVANTWVSPEPGEGDACCALTSFVPAVVAPAEAPLVVKILIDCSGSMAGDSMRLARQAIAAAIRQLRPTDVVSFSRFGSKTVHVIDRLVPLSGDHVMQLLKALSETDADLGGTELDRALHDVIALPDQRGELPGAASILLITDGEVWNIDTIVTTARQSGHQVYAIGVGSAPSESLVRELAEVTGGAAEFASPAEDMVAATARLMAKMRSMMDLDIAVEMDGKRISLPAQRYRVAPGEAVHLWYPLPRRPAQAPRIIVTECVGGVQQVLPETPLEWDAEGVVARMGAARRLLDVSQPGVRRDIALTYQLITAETNFFLVHERSAAEKASGMPALQQVGSMLAAGWGGASTVLRESTALYDVPAFCRRQLDDDDASAPRARALWRRGGDAEMAMVRSKSRRARGGVQAGSCLADLVAYPDDPANPLPRLTDMFEARVGDRAALSQLLVHIDADPTMAVLVPLLKSLESIVGDREAAIALLLYWWDDQHLAAVRISDSARQALVAGMGMVLSIAEQDGRAFLDAEAVHVSASTVMASDDLYDIPEFLRRQAD